MHVDWFSFLLPCVYTSGHILIIDLIQLWTPILIMVYVLNEPIKILEPNYYYITKLWGDCKSIWNIPSKIQEMYVLFHLMFNLKCICDLGTLKAADDRRIQLQLCSIRFLNINAAKIANGWVSVGIPHGTGTCSDLNWCFGEMPHLLVVLIYICCGFRSLYIGL